MHIQSLATDYDGTLAHDGHVDAEICDALRRFRASGRTLLLVTGRELPELLRIFPEIDLFTAAVVENGAVLYDPKTRTSKVLCEAAKPEFVERLRACGVTPLSCGNGIVATFRPNERIVLEVIREMGLELQVIFNKDAVMVLPSGVNKATGLMAALQELGLTAQATAGIGDAENDHAMLAMCGYSAAVANALPALKERANMVTQGHHGAGVVELINRILDDQVPDVEKPETAIRAAELAVQAETAGS